MGPDIVQKLSVLYSVRLAILVLEHLSSVQVEPQYHHTTVIQHH